MASVQAAPAVQQSGPSAPSAQQAQQQAKIRDALMVGAPLPYLTLPYPTLSALMSTLPMPMQSLTTSEEI